jgi:hypothetical protein
MEIVKIQIHTGKLIQPLLIVVFIITPPEGEVI